MRISDWMSDVCSSDLWRECLAKGAFANAGSATFDLIETMRFDPREGIGHLLLHLQRIEDSARAFGFAFDRHDIRNELQTAVFPLRQSARVRLLLSPSGTLRSEERTSELQSLMRISYAVFCLQKKISIKQNPL